MRKPNAPLPVSGTLLLLSFLAAVGSHGAAPADLRLRWKNPTALRGATGATVSVPYDLSNIGGSPAFAVILRAHTTLGPSGSPVRLQPGPAAGATITRTLSFALAAGMREVCVEAAHQSRGTDPPEPNLKDNRICRPVTVDAQPATKEETP